MSEWPEARAVDWSALPGAYGTAPDAAGALEALRAGPSAGDDFANAVDEFLWGHVWHQGSIYAITPKVLPFVLDVLVAFSTREVPGDDEPPEVIDERYFEMAELIAACAASARRARTGRDASERAVGAEALAVLDERADDLGRLTSLSSSALAAMACVPGLTDRVLTETEHAPLHVAAAILSRVDRFAFEPSLLVWAAPHVAGIKHAVTRAAAGLLRAGKIEGADAERLAAVGEAIGFSNADLVKHYLDELRPRFGISVPPPTYDRPGESRGIVAVVEADWFVVSVGKQNVTIRWRGHPFAENDAVILADIDKRNMPRAVRGTGEKAVHSAHFDDKGRML